MSDGWNHAGRSVRNRVGLGAGLGEQLWSTTLLCGQSLATDLEQSISCSRVGQPWLEDSLAFGMDNRNKTKTQQTNQKASHRDSKRREGHVGRRQTEHVRGQGRQNLSD